MRPRLGRFGALEPARRHRLLLVAAVGYLGLIGCALAVGPAPVWLVGAACTAVLVTAALPVVCGAVRRRGALTSATQSAESPDSVC